MVWAASGVGRLVFIDKIMDAVAYRRILAENLQQSAEQLGFTGNFYFVQDNDPKHTARIVKELFAQRPHIRVFPWPPQSPDLNPIEHLWDFLDHNINQHRISSISGLKQAIMEEWQKISSEVTQKLVASMPRRIVEVVRRGGRNTKY